MSRKLSKKKQAVWDKLNYVPPAKFGNHFANFDVNSMYPTVVFGVNKVELEEGELVTIKVLKSR